MEWILDLLQSMSNDPGTTGGSFAGMVSGGWVLKRVFDYLVSKNKADIVEAETDLEQTKAHLAPLEKVAEAFLLSVQHFDDIASAIKESSQASTQASQATVAALEKLNADSTEKHDILQDSVGQIELSMGEVAKTMNNITDDDGQILTMLRQIAESVDTLAHEVKNWGEQNRQKETEMLSKIEEQGQKVAEIEKRITQEAPQATVTEIKPQAYTPKESPNIITGEQKTIGSRTQPIQPPNHIESKEEKPNDEPN